MAAAAFAVLLIVLPWMPPILGSFYGAGALVFGGGHVVLPLLEAGVVAPGWIDADSFLAGYGLAQAVPGPLFTFAAWVGALMGPEPNGLLGGILALLALFLPGFLILIAALPVWDRLRGLRRARSAMQGANAAVVGILGAALYDPVFTDAVGGRADFALALLCFVALVIWRMPPWVVVLTGAAGGAGLSLI